MRGDQVSVGTSGWQYRDWRGVLYPPTLPQRAWLEWYSQQFPVVEVDSTFYRLPDRSVFQDWAERTPGSFRFVVKASRYLTHVKRLHEPEEPVARLLDHAAGLGPKLAAILLQLPPTMKARADLLSQTLSAFGGVRVAVELRHETWWSEEIADVLRTHGAATVWADRRSTSVGPHWDTADWGYVRLHEGRAAPWPTYGPHALRSWARRLTTASASWSDAFVFFNNDPGGAAVRNAHSLRGLLQ